MPVQGQDIIEHLSEKDATSTEQVEKNRRTVRERGLALGYRFNQTSADKIYNTFDAHRLLHWEAGSGQQTALKLALFDLSFKDNGDLSDHSQLLSVVAKVGLNSKAAKNILDSNKYESLVRETEFL